MGRKSFQVKFLTRFGSSKITDELFQKKFSREGNPLGVGGKK